MEMKTFEEIINKARKELFALTGNNYTVHAIPSRENFEATIKAVDPSAPAHTEFFRDVVDVVCEVYEVTYDNLVSKFRATPLPEARGMIFYLLYCQGWTHMDIGRAFGGRDHSTVIHRINAHKTWAGNNSDYRKSWASARAILKDRGWVSEVNPRGGEMFVKSEPVLTAVS